MIATMQSFADQSLEFPRRIVCLTEETTETIYLLGAADKIVGVSGYTVRPPEAREKPKVSAFTTAKIDKILELAPDLVLTFSDLQADLARDLISRGISVMAFNQRSICEIFQMIQTVGRLIRRSVEAESLVTELDMHLSAIRRSAMRFPKRPKVFFEEWKQPLISGIRWVEELIEIAGGEPLFPALRSASMAKDRIVSPAQVAEQNPDVVIASWCGMKVNKQTIRERPGWDSINAVRQGHIFEIKSAYILQPGPAALSEGVRQIHAILCHVTGVPVLPDLAPDERCDVEINAIEETA